jgi:hypothetical protein
MTLNHFQEAFVAEEEELGDDLEQVEALQSKFDAYQRVNPIQNMYM